MELVKKMDQMKKEFLEKKRQLRESEDSLAKAQLGSTNTSSSNLEVSRLTRENTRLKREVDDLKSRLDQADLRGTTGREDYSKSDAEKFEQVITELRSRLHRVKQESDSTRQSVKAYESEINSLKALLELSESKNEVLKRHLGDFHTRNKQLESRVTSATAETHSSTYPTTGGDRDSGDQVVLVRAAVERERAKNYAQMAFLIEQLKYLRLKADLESSYRADLMFMKRFFLLKIDAYQACNRADLALLEEMGIYPDYSQLERERGGRRRTLAGVAHAIIATIRWRKRGALMQEIGQRKELVRRRVKQRP